MSSWPQSSRGPCRPTSSSRATPCARVQGPAYRTGMLISPDIELRRAVPEDAQALADAVVRNREFMKTWEPYRSEEYYTAREQAERIAEPGGALWLLFDRAADGR